MREMTYRENGKTYIRINKRQARKVYDAGKLILVNLYNMNPNGFWGRPMHIYKERGNDFDKFVNTFEYYNCAYSETGRYAAFYAELEEE